MRIQGKTVLITGGAKRIGRALCLALAAHGARLAIHYRRSKTQARRLQSQLQARGTSAEIFQADLRSPSQTHRLIRQVVRKMKNIDVLIHNASLYRKTPLEKVRGKDWEDLWRIHVCAAFFLAQALRKTRKGREAQKIIFLADSSTLHPHPDYIPYGVSKAALVPLTQALAKALAPHTQVNAILPGPILLPSSATVQVKKAIAQAVPLKKIGSPKDIVQTILFLIEQEFMTGALIAVDGGRSLV